MNFLPLILTAAMAAFASLYWPGFAAAQTAERKEALVISAFDDLTARATRDVREDALAVSEALFGLGYNVRRLENPPADVVSSALSRAVDAPLVVYYASTGGTVVELETRFEAASGSKSFVFLDLCRTASPALGDPESALPAAWEMPDSIPPSTYLAASISPGEPCTTAVEPIASHVIRALDVPGLALDLAFAQDDPDAAPLWTRTTLAETVVFRRPSSEMRLTAEHYAMLDTLSPDAQAQMIALWTQAGIAVDRDGGNALAASPQMVVQDTIVISAPVQPVRAAAAVVAPRVSSNATQVQDGVSLIAADPVRSVENRAVPGVGGLPTPSIIVGLIATEAAFGTVTEDGGALSGSELDFTNIEARRAMRDEDPTLFASLIETGAFDPQPSELVIALQTELARMECYTAGIDGSWGGGSSSALGRYYDEIDETPPNLEPTIVAFRQILQRDDIVCPPVVVAAPAPRQTNSTAAPRRTTTTTAAPRRQSAPAPAAPAPAAPAPSRTINRSTATGVFR